LYQLIDKRICLIIIRSVFIILSIIIIAVAVKENAPYLKPKNLKPYNKPGQYIVFLKESQRTNEFLIWRKQTAHVIIF